MEFDYFDVMTYAKKGYSRFLEPACKQWGLNRSELDVLLFLANNPGLDRAADIVSHRGLAKSHVSLSVSTLESKGLLLREMDPGDRRTVHLMLTPKGLEAANDGREAQKAFFRKIHEGITPEEMAVWRGMTEKISRNIKNLEE